jgi:hypothetical protein
MGASRILLARYVEPYNARDLGTLMDLYARGRRPADPDGTFAGRSTIRDFVRQSRSS